MDSFVKTASEFITKHNLLGSQLGEAIGNSIDAIRRAVAGDFSGATAAADKNGANYGEVMGDAAHTRDAACEEEPMCVVLTNKSKKLLTLLEATGYDDIVVLGEAAFSDAVCPAICMTEGCDHTADMEPDQRKAIVMYAAVKRW